MSNPLLAIFETPSLVVRFKQDFEYGCDELYKSFAELMVNLEERKHSITDRNIKKRLAKEERSLALQNEKEQIRREISRLSSLKKEKLAVLKLRKSKHESIISSLKTALIDTDEDTLLRETVALEEIKAAETDQLVSTHSKFSAFVALYENFLDVKIKFVEPDTYKFYFSPERYVQFNSDDMILWKITGGTLLKRDMEDLEEELSTSRSIKKTVCRARKILINYQ